MEQGNGLKTPLTFLFDPIQWGGSVANLMTCFPDNPGPSSTPPKDEQGWLSLVYEELRTLAARKMSQEYGNQTLQATALVHEAWLRLGGDQQPAWKNRSQFFFAAAEAMRRILIDRARRKRAVRHGGGLYREPLDGLEIACPGEDDELLAVSEALEKLRLESPKKAELVKLRYFGGLSLKETASLLGISEPTAVRWWLYSKAWLFRSISESKADISSNAS